MEWKDIQCPLPIETDKAPLRHNSCQCYAPAGTVAGASFFYKPGTLPYEAQEVRAFGLFLSDMLDRLDNASRDAPAVGQLREIAAQSLQPLPQQRPGFADIAARCEGLL
jgi:hypothetical protein